MIKAPQEASFEVLSLIVNPYLRFYTGIKRMFDGA